MKNLVSRENGYLEIENETDIKTKMYYMLEKINDLEEKVKLGKIAENELKALNEEFIELCKLVIKGDIEC